MPDMDDIPDMDDETGVQEDDDDAALPTQAVSNPAATTSGSVLLLTSRFHSVRSDGTFGE
jgi:hypothetical protein